MLLVSLVSLVSCLNSIKMDIYFIALLYKQNLTSESKNNIISIN